jgi:hypothetical protein
MKPHGGKRKGSGRKPTGRKPYLVRMKPETMKAIKVSAKRRGLKTPGDVLDADYL